MRVLLLQPDDGRFDSSSLLDTTIFSYGLLYIASPLTLAGHEVSIDLTTYGNIEKLLDMHSPDVVGMTFTTPKYPAAREILLKIKELAPEVKTVVGGHHATFLTDDVLEETGCDYVVRGEGEDVFPKLVDSIGAGRLKPKIAGVSYPRHVSESIARVENLDLLPMPNWRLIPKKYRTRKARILSSRGCPFGCEFCSVSEFHGRTWRTRSVGNILGEVESLLSAGFKTIEFIDDNFTFDFQRVIDFCNGIGDRGLDFSWGVQARVDDIYRNPIMLGLLADAGCYRVSVGVESGIQDILDSYGKKITVEQTRKVVGWVKDSGMLGFWYFILGSGNIYDNKYYMEKSISFMDSLDLDVAQVSILTPFPGTRLYERLESEGRLLHKDFRRYDGSHCVYQPAGMTAKQMEEYFIEAYKRLYLNKGPLELARKMRKAHKTGFMEHAALKNVAELLARKYVLGEEWDNISAGNK